jgi:ABC-type Fe3+/spermidine/putrescine transport system ATPase subunit
VFPASTEVSAAQAHTDGDIKMISYQGAVTRFSVEADGMRITAETPAESVRFKEGDKVRLIWPKSAMVTMEEGA